MPALHGPWRLLVPVVIGLLLLGVWLAGRIGIADIYRYQVRRDLAQWEASGSVVDLARWRRAWSYNQKSLSLDGDNPMYLNQAARVWEWRMFVTGRQSEDPRPIIQRAIEFQRKALRAQPVWPSSWAHLAVLKARNMEFDAEFEAAVERSVELGPWQPGVHIILVDIGLMRWNLLADSTRGLVAKAFSRRTSSEGSLAGWLESIEDEPVFTTLCEQSDLKSMQPEARLACEAAEEGIHSP